MTTTRRFALALAIALFGSFALATTASADFHLMKIRQIHPSGNMFGGDWVQLQMYAPGQNQVAGKFIKSYDGAGNEFDEYQLNADVPNGDNQRSILISSAFTPAGVDADFYAAGFEIPGTTGAVCFQDNNLAQTIIDCVAYGNFTGSLPATPPAVATPFDSTLERKITRNCPTFLEGADDTNSSAADFALSTNPPRNNASEPTEVPCGTGGGAAIRCGGLKATNVGSRGPDVLRGSPKRDVIAGRGGNDRIRGLGRADVLCGGRGKDRLIGGKGRDRLLGGPGRDILRGGSGKDKLRGGPGLDIQVQ